MKVPERLAKIFAPVRELVVKLTPAQRISLALLAMVMLTGMGMLVFTTPQSARMLPFHGVPDGDTLALLRDGGFEHKIEDGMLFVRQQDIPQLSMQLIDAGADEKAPEYMDWLYKAMGFNDTTGRLNMRHDDSIRRSLESAITSYEGIAQAKVFVNKVEHPFRVRNSINSTASVLLTLEKNVKRVSPRTARVAGKLVAFAIGIPLAGVEVSDNHGSDYKLDEDPAISADGLLDRERQMRTKLSNAVFDVELSPSEYSLVVDLKVNRTAKRARSIKVDPEASHGMVKRAFEEETESIVPSSFAPGTKPNVSGFTNNGSAENRNKSSRAEEERENRFGETEEDSVTPAGDEEKWSILAKISKPAIERLLKRDRELTGANWEPTPEELNTAVAEKLARYKAQLESFPTSPQTAVTVGTFMPTEFATADGLDDRGGALAFLAGHVREIVLATLALFACFLLYRVATGVPELEPLPDPVAELAAFLREKEAAEEAARAAVEDGEDEGPQEWEVGEEEKADMELLEEVLEYSRERPEITANVVRLWMNDADIEVPTAREEPQS